MVEAAQAQPAWVLLAYLVAGVCFILALRGLSGPESSRRGNRTGMIGMAIAVLTTLITHVDPNKICVTSPNGQVEAAKYINWCSHGDLGDFLLIAAAIAIGGAIGLITARKIQMTAMPQLVAAFHSLVGM